MAEDPVWEIAPLARTHDRAAFDCGEPALDAFLARYARKHKDQGISRTWVATLPGGKAVAGYFTLSLGVVGIRDLPESERRRLPRHPIPVIHLGRLAVDRSEAGRGLGEVLLVEALRIALRASEAVGACAVEVVANNEEARAFYGKYGFASLEDDPLHLHLPMETVRRAFTGKGGGGTSVPPGR